MELTLIEAAVIVYGIPMAIYFCLRLFSSPEVPLTEEDKLDFRENERRRDGDT